MMEPPDVERAPEELTQVRLKRLGEGVGKVVYASEHWVVRRERSPSEIVALILIWKGLRKIAHVLPRGIGDRLLSRPSRLIRFLRFVMQAVMRVLPRGWWMVTHSFEMFRTYRKRDIRGERLAETYLTGTPLVPRRIRFPVTRVRVAGWPGWLSVTEATERVEATLHQRLVDLAREGHNDAVEEWLDRFLALRQAGWQRGLFSVDSHLKNFGVSGDRVVLLDPGGLTDRWADIESRLDFEEVVSEPHIQLGLGSVLGARPEIAERFNVQWKELVSREGVRRNWPDVRAVP